MKNDFSLELIIAENCAVIMENCTVNMENHAVIIENCAESSVACNAKGQSPLHIVVQNSNQPQTIAILNKVLFLTFSLSIHFCLTLCLSIYLYLHHSNIKFSCNSIVHLRKYTFQKPVV